MGPKPVKSVSITSIDNVLSNEMLLHIFNFLPVADRMRVELVSEKWKRLAINWCWNKQKVIAREQFPNCDKWKNAHSKFKSLFLRCSRFTRELNLSFASANANVCALLPLLPNLLHLDLHGDFLSRSAFSIISDKFPGLISFKIDCPKAESFGGITSVFAKCSQLEMLTVYGGSIFSGDAYHFSDLPPALKYVYLGPFFDRRSFFLQLVEQGIQLESLNFQEFCLSDSDMYSTFWCSLSAISFDRLKYLALKLCQYVIGGFIQLSWKLTRLQALELYIFDQTKGNWTDELFEVIVSNCPNLRHFAFHLLEENHVNGDKLALLASLPNLCSVHIRSGVSTGRVPVWTLFRKLSLSGRLKYFYTDEALFVKDVCEALDQCRYFTNIYCSRRDDEQQTEVFHQMLTTLDKIHEGEPIPATVNDERILHICFGGSRKDKLPKHPWAKFYADELDIFLSVPLSASTVREQIRFEGVSNKPNSWHP